MPMHLRDLNRRLLWMQYLSRQASGKDAVVTAAEACCGINSQDYRESFTSFWARVEGFRDSLLLSELRPRGGLVRTWTVRFTMHTIPSRDYYVHVLGAADEKRLEWIEKVATARGYPRRQKRIELFYQPLLKSIEGRAVTTADIKRLMAQRARDLGYKAGAWVGLGEMACLAMIVNSGRKGSTSLWMRADEWVSRPKRIPEPEACRAELVRKYVRQYGPVSRADILYWTGLSSREVDTALKALEADLVKVNVEGSKEAHFTSDESPRDIWAEPPNTIILPEFDSLMMGYRDKSRFMNMVHYKKVFGPLAMVRRTILLEGLLAAVWRRKREGREIVIEAEALREVSTSEKRAVDEKFSEYCDYLGVESRVRWL